MAKVKRGSWVFASTIAMFFCVSALFGSINTYKDEHVVENQLFDVKNVRSVHLKMKGNLGIEYVATSDTAILGCEEKEYCDDQMKLSSRIEGDVLTIESAEPAYGSVRLQLPNSINVIEVEGGSSDDFTLNVSSPSVNGGSSNPVVVQQLTVKVKSVASIVLFGTHFKKVDVTFEKSVANSNNIPSGNKPSFTLNNSYIDNLSLKMPEGRIRFNDNDEIGQTNLQLGSQVVFENLPLMTMKKLSIKPLLN